MPFDARLAKLPAGIAYVVASGPAVLIVPLGVVNVIVPTVLLKND